MKTSGVSGECPELFSKLLKPSVIDAEKNDRRVGDAGSDGVSNIVSGYRVYF